jgi:hypothetical protein
MHSEAYKPHPNSIKTDLGVERRESATKQLIDRRASSNGLGEFGNFLRSPTMWSMLFVPALLALAAVIYMISNLHPGPGRVPGVGDSGSPNAQPGDNARG